MSAVTLQIDKATGAKTPQALHTACNEMVGLMFGQLLHQARGSTLAKGLTDSPALRTFQGQLDDVLIQSASRGDKGTGVFSAVADGLYRQLSHTRGAAAKPVLDMKG